MLAAGVAIAAMMAVAGVAEAQGIPTTDEVSDSLDAACATTLQIAVVGPLDAVACLAAVDDAIDVAAAYAALNPPNEPDQVEIGFMLCQLAQTRAIIEQAILDRIDASENELLKVGCSAVTVPEAGDPAVNTPV